MTPLRLTTAIVPAMLPVVVAHATPVPLEPSPAAAACVAPFTPLSTAALTYDFIGSTVTSDGVGKSHELVMMRGHATAVGDRVRIDVNSAGAADPFMRGQYLLVFDNGRRVIWVDPVTRRYRAMAPRSLTAGLDAMTDGSNGIIMMEASNVSIDAEKVGAGPTIQGHSTVHYRLRQRMDMRTTVFYTTLVTHDESTTDYYYATDVPALINPFLSGTTELPPEKQMILGEEYSRQLRAAMNKLYHGSTPLRTVVSAKSTDERGHSRTTVTTTEVTNLQQQQNVNATVFEIPSDYTRIDVPPMNVPPGLLDPATKGMTGEPFWSKPSSVVPRGPDALGPSPYSFAPVN